jgi:hypothetical protein
MYPEGLKKFTKNISTIGLRAKVVSAENLLCPQEMNMRSIEE